MVRFSYKGGCGLLECMLNEALKAELVWAIDIWLQVIINTMSFLTVMPLRI